jgi:hypothetical protein
MSKYGWKPNIPIIPRLLRGGLSLTAHAVERYEKYTHIDLS